jgi:hypothetical protein
MLNEVEMQLALRSKAMTLVVATTGSISLAATATGFTRSASTGTVTSTLGFAEFSDSQAGKLAAGSKIIVDGVTYTLETFNGGTLATLSSERSDEPSFAASAFTMGFVVENFAPGMEVALSGFTMTAPQVITAVTATTLTTTLRSGTRTTQAAASGRSLTVGLPSDRAYENVAFQPTAGVPWVREEFLPGPTGQATVGPFGRLDAFPMYALHIHVKDETGLTVKRYVNALRVLFAPRTKIPLPTSGTLAVRSDTGPYAGQLQQSQPGFVVQPFTIPLRLLDSSNII